MPFVFVLQVGTFRSDIDWFVMSELKRQPADTGLGRADALKQPAGQAPHLAHQFQLQQLRLQ